MNIHLLKEFLSIEKISPATLSELKTKPLPDWSLLCLIPKEEILQMKSNNIPKKNVRKRRKSKNSPILLPKNEFFIPSAIFKIDLLLTVFTLSETNPLSGNLMAEISKLKNQMKKVFKEVFVRIGQYNEDQIIYEKMAIVLFFEYCERFIDKCFDIFNNHSIVSDFLGHLFIFTNHIIQNTNECSFMFEPIYKIIQTYIKRVLIPNNEYKSWIELLIFELNTHIGSKFMINNQSEYISNIKQFSFKVGF